MAGTKQFAGRTLRAAILAAAVVTGGSTAAYGDVVLDWNLRMTTSLAGQIPFAAARIAAITQLAVFEAVNAISQEYQPYLADGTITAAAGASVDAAAAAAAHAALKHYLPAQADALDAALAASLSAIPDGQAKTDGIATGEAAAAAMIALRANDGSASPQFFVPTSSAPGQWQPTPSCAATGGRGAQFHWRNVTPFGIPSGSAFRLGPPPALVDGRYDHDYAEVKAVGRIDSVLRPPDRTEVATFYAMTSPTSWANSAARQVAVAQARSLSENARGLALLNMAISDGAVAAFDTKYHYTFWRPETAIHAGDTDGNPKTDADATYAPYIGAPCFPSYPSAHASLSSAARAVLERLYGRTGHDITLTNSILPGVSLHYTDFKRIVQDIDDARVYGGIHFRFDQEGGANQGRAIGAYVYRNNLRVAYP